MEGHASGLALAWLAVVAPITANFLWNLVSIGDDRDDGLVDSVSSNGKRRVSFNEMVDCRYIPSRMDYNAEERSTLWSSAEELREQLQAALYEAWHEEAQGNTFPGGLTSNKDVVLESTQAALIS